MTTNIIQINQTIKNNMEVVRNVCPNTVNPQVPGSSPGRGANKINRLQTFSCDSFFI